MAIAARIVILIDSLSCWNKIWCVHHAMLLPHACTSLYESTKLFSASGQLNDLISYAKQDVTLHEAILLQTSDVTALKTDEISAVVLQP